MSRLGQWRACSEPGCGQLVKAGTGKCKSCRSKRRRKADAMRPSASERGYGSHWHTQVRTPFLERFPDCECGAPATVADHHPITRDELVRQGVVDPDAWEHLVPRCASCHSSKTVKEDGGFGLVPDGEGHSA